MDVAVIFGSSSMNMLPNLITFTGTPGLSYTLQTSPNLVDWTDQQELTSETGEFLVPVSLDASYRFFRIIETPAH
jgi:hypothetical protein